MQRERNIRKAHYRVTRKRWKRARKEEKIVEKYKNNMSRNRYFKCATQNSGKKRLGLRSAQDADEKVHQNKENIEQKLRDSSKYILVKWKIQ